MSDNASPGRERILVVDDTPAVITLVRRILEPEGYELSVATDGASGLERFSRVRPDLVILDISMPVMDGFEACARMRALPEGRDTPIIFLSALAAGEDKARAFETGGSDYMTKPMDQAELKARVRTHLAKARLDRRERQLNEELERTVEERTAELRRLLEERTVLLGEINHRVMNSLQILVSLAERQAEESSSEDTRSALASIQRRAGTIAMVYSHLARSGDLSSIDAGECLGEIAAHVLPAGGPRTRAELADVRLDVSRAVAFGLLASELLSNAALHAYPAGGEPGEVRLFLRAEGGKVSLGVEDDGRGFRRKGGAEGGGIGLHLVDLLARQLGGRLGFEGPPGTKALLEFGLGGDYPLSR